MSGRPGGNPPKRGSDGWTFLALMGLFVAALALIGMAALVLPQVIAILAVVGVFGMFILLQYMLWGWWYTGGQENEDDSE